MNIYRQILPQKNLRVKFIYRIDFRPLFAGNSSHQVNYDIQSARTSSIDAFYILHDSVMNRSNF